VLALVPDVDQLGVVAVPVLAPVIPTFTQAAVRFAISFAALIGLSLLLAGL